MSALPLPPFAVCAKVSSPAQTDATFLALQPMLRVWLIDLIRHHASSDSVLDFFADRRNGGSCDEMFGEGFSEQIFVQDESPFPRRRPGERREDPLRAEKLRQIDRVLGRARAVAVRKGVDYAQPFWHNLARFANLLKLDPAEQFVLCFSASLDAVGPFARAVTELSIRVDMAGLTRLLTQLSGLPRSAIALALSVRGGLRTTGLLSVDSDACDLECKIDLRCDLAELLFERLFSEEELLERFVEKCPAASLSLDRFPHLAQDTEIVAGLLRDAKQTGRAGTNILLYGPPGVGKTEYTVALARALELSAFEVKYEDENGEPIGGEDRLTAYKLSQKLLARNARALLIFDEIEDVFRANPLSLVFGGAGSSGGGKARTNRSLESNPVPAIWITNDVEDMDPAFLRRFDYAVQFSVPPLSVRKEIALHHLASWVPAEDDDWLPAIAARSQMTPSQLEKAAHVADSLIGAPEDEAKASQGRWLITRVLDRSAALLGQAPVPLRSSGTTAFDLAYLNADTELSGLVAALGRRPKGTFCFYGAPGTGKTESGRHLAEAIDRPVIVRRASDLLSKWVGETEQRIARMFDEARQQHAVLILDEADSLLRSRVSAEHSWEVTQVNELLTQMEAFDGIFICTTNLVGMLDPASLRRFDWKVHFRPLSARQRWALFAQEFLRLGGTLAAARSVEPRIARLEGLCAGDVATVVRQYRLLDIEPEAMEFALRLEAEVRLRAAPGTEASPLSNVRQTNRQGENHEHA
jgi:SpoVK/Ycf46/Vps4 family AAA+-type ATPase